MMMLKWVMGNKVRKKRIRNVYIRGELGSHHCKEKVMGEVDYDGQAHVPQSLGLDAF